MKAIRVSIYVIAGLLVLLVGAALIFAMTFDPNRYKGQIEALVKEKTGRTLKLAGNLEVAIWPSLGAKVNGVTLSERAADQQFVSLESAHAAVALMPLLRGQAVVDKIRISGLKANVVKEKDGRFNFSDLMEAKPEKPSPKGPSKDSPEVKSGAAVGFDIAGVTIERSQVSYLDKASGQSLALSDFNLSTGRIGEKADGKLDLKASVKGKNPDLDLKVDVASGYKIDLAAKNYEVSKLDAKVSGVMDKQSLEARVTSPELVVSADKAKGSLDADVRMKGGPKELSATLKLDGIEGSAKALVIPKLAAELSMGGPKPFKVPVSGSVRADLEKQTASAELHSKFDESTVQAKLGLAKFSPPAYNFDVNVDRLNLDRYFPPEEKAVTTPGEAAQKPAAEKPKPAAETPVDLSFLKELNANGRLQVGALQAQGLKVANLKAEVHAANGRLDLPHTASLYEGATSGALGAQADGRVAFKETLQGIAIGPLLRDYAKKDTLEGKGNVSLDVTAAGKTVEQMKKSLAGNAKVQLRDGAIKGINLAEVFRRARSALGSQEARAQARETQKTDFSEMSASFQIRNGVAHNEDLDMKSPLFRIGGKGDIDIGNSKLDYTTKATVVASTKGQGGADVAQLSGLTVPVRLSGPFDALKYDVDYGAAASNLAKSKAGEKIKDALKERLGGRGQDGGQSGSGGSQLDKLKGLFGR
jgi:AsmA protein